MSVPLPTANNDFYVINARKAIQYTTSISWITENFFINRTNPKKKLLKWSLAI